MTAIIYCEILLLVFCFVFLFCRRWSWCWSKRGPKNALLTNWPFVGMLPGLVLNVHRVHDFVTVILGQCEGTFEFKGPWLCNLNMLLTCDPTNIHYILSKNFSNFSKGPDFKKIFDLLGDGIFNSDSKSWETQRKSAKLLLNHHSFQKFVHETSWNKVGNGLMPILDRVSKNGTEVDLQGFFQRFTFDTTCILVLGHDPATLSVELPHILYEKAFGDAEEAALYRHILPEFWWKFQSWLQIGKEKKLTKAIESLQDFLDHCISKKRHQLREMKKVQDSQDLLTGYMMAVGDKSTISAGNNSDKNFRDQLLNLLFAGRDTVSAALTWLFWLIATNPLQENKIRQEISAILNMTGDGKWRILNGEELKTMVYLHGALCESLRLFPPVPLQHKAPLQADILPSGHRVDKNTKTVLSFFSMGRMESIWGKDCLQFKPERWITEQGGIKHEPSFKFTAFNAGPRTCLGKEMSFIQLKIVAASIVFHYKVELVGGQSICPSDSVILHMKHGLKVRITKRCVT